LENKNVKESYLTGESFTVNVNLSEMEEGTVILGTAINYDDTMFDIKVSRKIANDFAKGINPANQVVTLYVSSSNDETLEEGTLGTITFTVKEGASGTTKITFANVEIDNNDKSKIDTVITNELTIHIKEAEEIVVPVIEDEKHTEKEQNNTVEIENETTKETTGKKDTVTPATTTKTLSQPTETKAQWFEDVKTSDWFYEAVKYVVDNKIFNGMSLAEYGPNISMTRGMLVTVLYRMNGITESEESTFNDVASGIYYSAPIAWTAKNGIVNGVGNNSFAPDRAITREELATIMARYLTNFKIEIAEENVTSQEFVDEKEIANYAKDNVKLLQERGLMTGKNGNVFDPKGYTTRAEVATLLMRLANKTK